MVFAHYGAIFTLFRRQSLIQGNLALLAASAGAAPSHFQSCCLCSHQGGHTGQRDGPLATLAARTRRATNNDYSLNAPPQDLHKDEEEDAPPAAGLHNLVHGGFHVARQRNGLSSALPVCPRRAADECDRLYALLQDVHVNRGFSWLARRPAVRPHPHARHPGATRCACAPRPGSAARTSRWRPRRTTAATLGC